MTRLSELELRAEQHDEISGFLNKAEMQKIRNIALKPASPYRRSTYTTWCCADCSHFFYYKVIRCPACESTCVEEKVNPAKYEYADMVMHPDRRPLSELTGN